MLMTHHGAIHWWVFVICTAPVMATVALQSQQYPEGRLGYGIIFSIIKPWEYSHDYDQQDIR